MLAFTESHPKLKRFSVLKLDPRFMQERPSLAMIAEEELSREHN